MDLGVSIVTCDRRQFGKRNYLAQQWESLCAAGVLSLGRDSIRIFDAGPGDSWAEEARCLTGCTVVPCEGPGPLSIARNGHRAMEWIAGRSGPTLFFQDDVLVQPHLLRTCDTRLTKTAPAADTYTFCAPYWWTQTPENLLRGWSMYPPEQFYGLWAMLLLPKTTQEYLASEERRGADILGAGADLWFGRWCRQTEHSLCAHCPNLARHIGVESTQNNVHQEMHF